MYGDRVVDVEVGIARRSRLVCIGFKQPRGMQAERAVDEDPRRVRLLGFVEERASILFAVDTLTPVAPNLHAVIVGQQFLEIGQSRDVRSPHS